MSHEMVIHLSSGYFCAAVVTKDATVIRTAPILKHMNGWSIERVKAYANKKGWKLHLAKAGPGHFPMEEQKP